MTGKEEAGKVHIWSGERRAYWRDGAAGYTSDVAQAGLYSPEQAQHYLDRVGPEKRLEIRPALARPLSPGYGELVERLKPFKSAAEAYTSFDGQHDYLDSDVVVECGFTKITVGNLRDAALAATALAALSARVEELEGALSGLLPWLEDAETKCLVGDEGCIWAVERARSALSTAGGTD